MTVRKPFKIRVVIKKTMPAQKAEHQAAPGGTA
jgi:hypothetical protein